MEESDAPKLPSGTVTFLFTDIEGSTELLRKLRDRYGDAVAEHPRLLRATVEAGGGHEVDTQGDSFFFAFRRAGNAAAAAAAAQRTLAEHVWPDGVHLRVRMGLHTGGTLTRLGISGSLKRTLESTNPCESMIECVRRSSRNVKRWQSGEMALRWTAAGMLEAERQFRRIIGYRELAKLAVAIERDLTGTTVRSPTEGTMGLARA